MSTSLIYIILSTRGSRRPSGLRKTKHSTNSLAHRTTWLRSDLRAHRHQHRQTPQAQPLEPILFPKLRIYFVDFPYLHYSIDQRLLTLETCCGYEYDLARNSSLSLGFSRISRYAPDTSKGEVLCRRSNPISIQYDSRVLRASLKRKENSFQGSG